MRHLIINADDFGYSYSVNRGIIEAHEAGIVTSTTVLVDFLAAHEAANLNSYPNLSVGLHFWPKSIENVEEEFRRQVEKLTDLLGRKPDSIDTHKRLPTEIESIELAIRRYSEENKTPVRGFGYAKFIESFFGLNVDGSGVLNPENVSLEAFKSSVAEATDEYNELMCHVGYSDDHLRNESSYNDIREEELKTLLSSEVKEFLGSQEDLKLINWKDVQKAIF